MKNGDYILVSAPKNYPGKLYRGKYCYEHHLCYWKHYGVIPKDDEIIHHKDENKHNNIIDNLELMKLIDHVRLHNAEKKKHMVLLQCPICKTQFVKQRRDTHLVKGGRATYCSKECLYKSNALRVKKDEEFLMYEKQNVIHEFFG